MTSHNFLLLLDSICVSFQTGHFLQRVDNVFRLSVFLFVWFNNNKKMIRFWNHWNCTYHTNDCSYFSTQICYKYVSAFIECRYCCTEFPHESSTIFFLFIDFFFINYINYFSQILLWLTSFGRCRKIKIPVFFLFSCKWYLTHIEAC